MSPGVIPKQHKGLIKVLTGFYLKISKSMSRRTARSRHFNNPYPEFDSLQWSNADAVRQRLESLMSQVSLISHHIREHATGDDADGSLYVGPAGIAFAFYHKAMNFQQGGPQQRDDLLTAKRFSDFNLEYARQCRRPMSPGFLLGESGAVAISAAINHALGDREAANHDAQRFSHFSQTFLPLEVYSYGSDELLVGRAGYICGALWLNRVMGRPVVPQTLLCQICDSMLESGHRYSRRHRSDSPLMYAYHGTEYLGAAHGLCSILQMFLTVPGYFDGLPDEKKRLVVSSVDYVLAIQQSNGNFPCATDEITRKRPPENELVHWCHGSPGTVYLMARAYKVMGDPKYLQSALKCGENVWQLGLLRKGPGICHGVAGSGYVFLLLHGLTRDRKYLYRAQKFADFIQTEEFRQGARQPDCPLSLYEGWAGTMCFLVNLTNPDNIRGQFPFFENCLE